MAKPVAYDLDLKKSKVVFYYEFGGNPQKGLFPVIRAQTMVDLQNARRTTLDVTISTKGVKTSDPFSTIGLHGVTLLNTAAHPTARFKSTKVTSGANGAKVTGDLTLNGTTRAITLDAVFQREALAPTDNSELILQVSGDISRAAFGVLGYPNLVGDTITLRFVVYLTRH